MRRGRGRPLRPPGASVRLLGRECDGIPQYAGPGQRDAIWAATALSGAGLRLGHPTERRGVTISPPALQALSAGLREIDRTGSISVDIVMTLGCAGVRIDARIADGIVQATLRWPHSHGIVLMGEELLHFAGVAETAWGFAVEWITHPHLDYWHSEFAQIPGVEVVDSATGMALPRQKPRAPRATRAA